jgi:hypothetical protein
VDAALGGGAFAGDDAVAHDGQRLSAVLRQEIFEGSGRDGSATLSVEADIGTLLIFLF